MSTLIFDGVSHRIEILSNQGLSLGKWTAFNNIDTGFAKLHFGSLTHLKNGIYSIEDRIHPFLNPGDSSNGPFGKYGIIHFTYPGHPGIGIHSGRANAANQPGAAHATHGCIRTTDEAMGAIKAVMENDHLTFLSIIGNDAASVRVGNLKSASGHQSIAHH